MPNKTAKHAAKIKQESKVPSTFEKLRENLAKLAAEQRIADKIVEIDQAEADGRLAEVAQSIPSIDEQLS